MLCIMGQCLLFVKTDRICMILHKWVEKREWYPGNLWLMASSGHSWTTYLEQCTKHGAG